MDRWASASRSLLATSSSCSRWTSGEQSSSVAEVELVATSDRQLSTSGSQSPATVACCCCCCFHTTRRNKQLSCRRKAALSHSRSFEMVPFDRSHTSFYWRCIVNVALSCIISEIKRTVIENRDFCRAMLCISAAPGLCRHAVSVCLPVRPSVCHVSAFCRNA